MIDRLRLRLSAAAARRLRLVAATVIAVLAFALVGAAAGPRWDPTPLDTTVEPATADPSIAGSDPDTTLGRYETTSRIEEIEIADGVTTRVLVVEPVGLTSPAPAVVFLHGAGTGHAESFTQHAEALASAGIVALSPAKRLDTYSTFHRDYVAMAADYEATVAFARTLPQVDPDRVGLYAESEGTWIAPVLATTDPDLAFLALISAPVVTPREQGAFAVDAYLRNVGVPEPLLRAIPRAAGARLPEGLLDYADFDVLPYLSQVSQPVLMVYGTADASMPTVQGPQLVAGALPGGSEQLMVRYFAGANHGLRIGSSTDPLVPEFLAATAQWILDPTAAMAAGPAIAGATPVQRNLASAVPQPRWYADGEMLLRVPGISATVLGLGYLLLLVAAVTRVVRRRPRATRYPRAALWFSVATLAVVLTLVVYVVAVAQLALNYSTNAAMVWGGWVLLQGLAVAAAATGVIAVGRLVHRAQAWWHARPTTLGSGVGRVTAVLRAAGAVAVVLGSSGLLVVAAYWGAFSPLS